MENIIKLLDRRLRDRLGRRLWRRLDRKHRVKKSEESLHVELHRRFGVRLRGRLSIGINTTLNH